MSNYFKNTVRSLCSNPAQTTGAADASAAFNRLMLDWRASKRVNLAPDSDGNRLSTFSMEVEVGSYLINAPEVMLSSAGGVRTIGMEWTGFAGTQILFQPSSPGYLFYNNDEVQDIRVSNIIFNCNDASSGTYYSTTSGGAANVAWESCQWGGTWGTCISLAGSNDNSEMEFNRCQITGHYTNAFFEAGTSDQQLNYWWNQCSVSSLTGTFCQMVKGGHIKIDECDFSGYAQFTDPSDATLLFDLQGTSHAEGVCSFVDSGSRYEIGQYTTVMQSVWPAGVVTFDSVDTTSQAFQAWAPTSVTHKFDLGNNGGPQILHKNCNYLGKHQYTSGSASYSMRKIVRYEGCDNESLEDLFSMFITGMDSGSSFGGLPPILLQGCRGKQINWELAYTNHWSVGKTVNPNDIVVSSIWVYQSANGGVTGTTPIFGNAPGVDGTVTDWVCLNKFRSSEYLTDFIINKNKIMGCPSLEWGGSFNDINGRWPAASGGIPGTARLVLPPNAWLTDIDLHSAIGDSTQNSPGGYTVFTDEAVPTVLIPMTITPSFSLNGFDATWRGKYFTGTGQSQVLLLQSNLNVTTPPGFNGKHYSRVVYS